MIHLERRLTFHIEVPVSLKLVVFADQNLEEVRTVGRLHYQKDSGLPPGLRREASRSPVASHCSAQRRVRGRG